MADPAENRGAADASGDRDAGTVRLRLLLERVPVAARDPPEPGPVHDRPADQPAPVLHDVGPPRERHLRRDAARDPPQHRSLPPRASRLFRCRVRERGERVMAVPADLTRERDLPVVIAIDLGGTKAAVALIRADGRLLARSVAPTPRGSAKEAVAGF